jgi:predicted amidohydrolase
MAPKETKFKVAAAHAAPVFMDKAGSIKKTVRLIEQAAKDDIKLLVFPETFIPGYPVRVSAVNIKVIARANLDHSTGLNAMRPLSRLVFWPSTLKRAW